MLEHGGLAPDFSCGLAVHTPLRHLTGEVPKLPCCTFAAASRAYSRTLATLVQSTAGASSAVWRLRHGRTARRPPGAPRTRPRRSRLARARVRPMQVMPLAPSTLTTTWTTASASRARVSAPGILQVTGRSSSCRAPCHAGRRAGQWTRLARPCRTPAYPPPPSEPRARTGTPVHARAAGPIMSIIDRAGRFTRSSSCAAVYCTWYSTPGSNLQCCAELS